MDDSTANELLDKVRRDYDAISGDFSDTRNREWPEFEMLANTVEEGMSVLDVGCGNGRLIASLPEAADYTGLDNAEKLLDIARKQYPGRTFVNGDVLALPFGDQAFDRLACFAVLHHIPSKRFRQKATHEIFRVLKPGGIVFVTVWNVKGTNYKSLIWKNNIKKLFGRSKLDFNDVYIPWRRGRKTVDRYVHAFTMKELGECFHDSGFAIMDIGSSRGGMNLYVKAARPT